MISAEVAAMTRLAPARYDNLMMRSKRTVAGERCALYQAALPAAYHNPLLQPDALRLKERGKPHNPVIVAVTRRLVAIATILKKSSTSHY